MSTPPAGAGGAGPGDRPRLYVADELHDTLPAEAIRDAIATRNTSDVNCMVCRATIPATSDEQANLVVSTGPLAETVIQFAHARCARSGVTGRLVGPRREPTTIVVIGVRKHPSVPAMLLSEASAQVSVEGVGSLELVGWRELGLRPSPVGVLAAEEPFLDTLTLSLAETSVAVELTAGGVDRLARKLGVQGAAERAALRAYDVLDTSRFTSEDRTQWRNAIDRTGRCLLIVGDNLGLEYPDLERIDMLLADGKALAGVAPTRRPDG
jgi:hypothetical protein